MKDPRHLHRVPWVFLLGSFFSMLREYSQDIMLHDTHPQDAIDASLQACAVIHGTLFHIMQAVTRKL